MRPLINMTIYMLASVMFLAAGCGTPSLSNLNGTLLEPPMEVSNFQFSTADGLLELHDLKEQYVLMAFGYTFCPDACPTTMARLARVADAMGTDMEHVQVMLVSVDPERDTPELLKSYTQNFNPDFLGAIPTTPTPLFERLGIYVAYSDASDTTEDYTVDHTTSIILLDKQGNWRLVWNFETSPEEIAADLKTLIASS